MPPTSFTFRPDGRKKLDPNTWSHSCIRAATSRGGNASSSRKAMTNIAHVKNGRRIQVSPLARRLITVVSTFTAPSSEAEILNTMAKSHCV
jgi:hypothetical protein